MPNPAIVVACLPGEHGKQRYATHGRYDTPILLNARFLPIEADPCVNLHFFCAESRLGPKPKRGSWNSASVGLAAKTRPAHRCTVSSVAHNGGPATGNTRPYSRRPAIPNDPQAQEAKSPATAHLLGKIVVCDTGLRNVPLPWQPVVLFT